MTEAGTDERRRLSRKIADEIIEVYDFNSERYLGRVVNLTLEGMMLISPAQLESNLVFQLVLVPETPKHGRSRLQLGVESLWCFDANRPRHYWIGFRIIDVSMDTVELVENLVDDWRIDGDIH